MDELEKQEKQKTLEDDIAWQKLRWKNRRRMAWVSLIGGLIITALLFFAPVDNERMKIIAEPITWYYFCSSAVIGAYMGFTTIEKFKMGK